MIKRLIAMTICLVLVLTGTAFAELNVTSIDAPKNLTAELKAYEDGMPYFLLKVQVPESVRTLADNASEEEMSLFYEVEYKVGNGSWEQSGGVLFSEGPELIMNPDDMGINGEVDIKANVYSFRVKYGCYLSQVVDEDGNRNATGQIFSSFSNVASIGINALYKGASSWATAELDRAAEYGFITDKIKEKMNGPITREELCEVIIRLYEKMAGEAGYTDTSVFSDTTNPEIFKAYELGIVNGVGGGRFAPKDLTNREQVAAMMYRAVKKIKPGADFSTAGVESFKDLKQISAWALESVKFMNKNGFLKGSNGLVDPKGTTTREQAVLIVVRVYEKYLDN